MSDQSDNNPATTTTTLSDLDQELKAYTEAYETRFQVAKADGIHNSEHLVGLHERYHEGRQAIIARHTTPAPAPAGTPLADSIISRENQLAQAGGFAPPQPAGGHSDPMSLEQFARRVTEGQPSSAEEIDALGAELGRKAGLR